MVLARVKSEAEVPRTRTQADSSPEGGSSTDAFTSQSACGRGGVEWCVCTHAGTMQQQKQQQQGDHDAPAAAAAGRAGTLRWGCRGGWCRWGLTGRRQPTGAAQGVGWERAAGGSRARAVARPSTRSVHTRPRAENRTADANALHPEMSMTNGASELDPRRHPRQLGDRRFNVDDGGGEPQHLVTRRKSATSNVTFMAGVPPPPRRGSAGP